MAGSLRCGIGSLHAGQSLSYPLEQVLHVVSQLRARLHKHQVVLLGLILSLLCGNLSLVVQVGLVADQDNNNIVTSLRSDVVNPFLGVLERFCVCRAYVLACALGFRDEGQEIGISRT